MLKHLCLKAFDCGVPDSRSASRASVNRYRRRRYCYRHRHRLIVCSLKTLNITIVF